MEINNFNAMNEFNKLTAQNNIQVGKFGDNSFLEGHISMDVPSLSDMKLDADIMKDLNALNVNPAAKADGADSFYKSLSNAIGDGIRNVNELQRASNDATEYFASGGNIDIHSVLIASQKARMGLEMATQLRNKALSAYKEITRMSF